MQTKGRITFIYSDEDSDIFNRLRENWSGDFEIDYCQCKRWEQAALIPADFLLVSECFKNYVDETSFIYLNDNGSGWTFSDSGQDYQDINLKLAVKKEIELKKVQLDFSNLSQQLEIEISRLKSWSQKHLPIREKKEPNFYFCSKYKAGNRSGGDFFDFIEEKDSYIILMASTNSYLLSASAIEALSRYDTNSTSIAEDITSYLLAEKSVLDEKRKGISLDLFICEIDKRSLGYRGYNFGKTNIYSPDKSFRVQTNGLRAEKSFMDEAFFSGKLEPGVNFVVSSRGVIANWSKKSKLVDYYSNMSSASNAKESLEGIFLTLYEQDSMEYDSSIIWMEVDGYGIHEV